MGPQPRPGRRRVHHHPSGRRARPDAGRLPAARRATRRAPPAGDRVLLLRRRPVDPGILALTDRVWASDCIDPHERAQILRWTGQLLPPELVGSHVGSPVSHSTGRAHALSFRAATALFGSFGIEWDSTGADPPSAPNWPHGWHWPSGCAPLLHAGRTVRVDHPDQALRVHGIVAADRSEALFAFVMMDRPLTWPPAAVRLPGLVPRRRYELAPVGPLAGTEPLAGRTRPAWQRGGLAHSRAVPGTVGVQPPPLQPDHTALLHLRQCSAEHPR